jgi:hypothetical protein
MTIHPIDQTRTAATPPDRGMGWGIPVIVIAGVLLAGLFAFKSMEGHTGTTTIPISRADRLAPSSAPADATSPTPSSAGPGGTQ